MRRAASIIIGILLGAIASGIGVGVFLKLANDDRERLTRELERVANEATRARIENQRAIENANHMLTAANVEVTKAQQLIKALEEERRLLAEAKTLPTPPARTIRGWSDVVALDLGVSLKFPSGNTIESNNQDALTLVRNASTQTDARWLSLTPYDERREQELLSAFTTSTPVSYLVNGRVLAGRQGILPGQSQPVLVLRIRHAGVTSHLLWMRPPKEGQQDPLPMIDVLSTLRFES